MFNLFKRNRDAKPNVLRQDEFGYLGKTELKPDFIKFQVNSRESIALDHWVKEGFAYASRRSATHKQGDNSGSTNMFFMAGDETQADLIGIITPSVDSSGRQYPFVSFINIGQKVYRRHPSALFLNDCNDFKQLQKIANGIFTAPSDQEMQNQANKLKPVVSMFKQPAHINELLEKFRHITMEFFWNAIDVNDLEGRARLIDETSGILQSIANRGCLRSQQGLRFPMPNIDADFELVAAFWLHLVTVIVADHSWQPWVFYGIDTDKKISYLTLFTTPVAPSMFEGVWFTSSNSQSVVDFSKVSSSQAISDFSLSLAKMNNVSMYDALRRWCKV